MDIPPKPPVSDKSSAANRELARLVGQSLNEIADTAATRVCEQVAAYRRSADPTLHDDVAAHCLAVFQTFLHSLAENEEPQRDAFQATAVHAMRRVTQAIRLADFLQAFRISQLTLWDSILALSEHDSDLRAAATGSVRWVMRVIEVGSTMAAESYLEAQQYLLADAARAARDLLEDLLAGRQPGVGARQLTLRAAGPDASSGVIVAVTRGSNDSNERRAVLSALTHAGRTDPRGLVASRHGEIIGVLPVSGADSSGILDELRRVVASLRNHQIELSIGTSTVHSGLAAVPAAYREAQLAFAAVAPHGGVRSLDEFTAFDYLVAQPDSTAVRLIDPAVRRFVEEDHAAGGVYLQTMEAYVHADLNAKAAAEKLHVHPNTAYYRIDRIAERTGKDLRRFDEVFELLVAVRLLVGR